MIAVVRAPAQPVVSLFAWRERQEAERLESERRDLARRIAALPRYAHRRLVLEARLAEVTSRQLAAEAAARGRP